MNQKKDIRISISEVSERLGYKDNRTAKKWLTEKNIPIKRTGREWTVFEYLVEHEIQLELALDIKQMYPNTWAEIYDYKTDDKNMVKAVMTSLPKTNRIIKKTKKNNNPKKFIN